MRGRMLLIGRYNTLEIARITASGAFLKTDEGDVLLPGKFIPPGAEPGSSIEVFIYRDSEDRLVATVQRSLAVVGDFALLNVKDNTRIGAFLDWGLDKDLLLPFGEQPDPVKRGEPALVRVYLDNSGRIAASAKLEKFLSPAGGSLSEGDEVELLPYAFTEMGVKVIVNGAYGGLLFRNELYVKPARGKRLRGYVKKIRDDGKIDVTLRKGGAGEAARDRETILAALKAGGGFLPLTDKSSPEAIAELLRMSKKSFKKGVGGLYKEGLIDMTEDGIRLRSVKVEGSQSK
jgi:predicted RNA-binding protein (virulence factor B family)